MTHLIKQSVSRTTFNFITDKDVREWITNNANKFNDENTYVEVSDGVMYLEDRDTHEIAEVKAALVGRFGGFIEYGKRHFYVVDGYQFSKKENDGNIATIALAIEIDEDTKQPKGNIFGEVFEDKFVKDVLTTKEIITINGIKMRLTDMRELYKFMEK